MNSIITKFFKFCKRPIVYIDSFILAISDHLNYQLSDRTFLKLNYRRQMWRKLNLEDPQSFNEKLQWLKLNDHNPIYPILVDKYAVKEYLKPIIGEEYIIPTIGVFDSVDAIDFSSLPTCFVLKTTHGGGGTGVVICKDKALFDVGDAKEKLKKALEKDMYSPGREWVYKDVPRRIIAEAYMDDGSGEAIKDYKFFCFNGVCKMCKVDFGRFVDHHANYYDMDWQILPFGEECCPPDYRRKQDRPPHFAEMVIIAERLAKNIPFVRIDLYNVNGSIYFGEMTFYPASGIGRFIPEEADLQIGNMLRLQ